MLISSTWSASVRHSDEADLSYLAIWGEKKKKRKKKWSSHQRIFLKFCFLDEVVPATEDLGYGKWRLLHTIVSLSLSVCVFLFRQSRGYMGSFALFVSPPFFKVMSGGRCRGRWWPWWWRRYSQGVVLGRYWPCIMCVSVAPPPPQLPIFSPFSPLPRYKGSTHQKCNTDW